MLEKFSLPGRYKYILRDGRNKTYNKRKTLRNLGYTYSPDDYGYIAYGTRGDRKTHERTARKLGLRLVAKDEDFARDNTYRQRFFSANPPKIRGKYQCVYCGRLMDKEHTTVDHVIPVFQAQTSPYVQRLMQLMGITDVNELDNLVPACSSCNTRKGSDYSLMWTIRARLGSRPAFWGILYGGGALAVIGGAVLIISQLF